MPALWGMDCVFLCSTCEILRITINFRRHLEVSIYKQIPCSHNYFLLAAEGISGGLHCSEHELGKCRLSSESLYFQHPSSHRPTHFCLNYQPWDLALISKKTDETFPRMRSAGFCPRISELWNFLPSYMHAYTHKWGGGVSKSFPMTFF